MASSRSWRPKSALRPSLTPLALAFLLAGCPGEEGAAEQATPASGQDTRAQRAASLEAEQQALLDGAGHNRTLMQGDPDREEERPLAFATVTLSPEEASASVEEFKVRSTLEPGASAFTEVEYQWFVGGDELVGYTRPSLDKRKGGWTVGDRVEVVALASDEKGRSARSAPVGVVIGNTPPTITTDLSKMKYLNGTRLRAEDPDGDEITWSLAGNPPGVSVSAKGVVAVRDVQLTEDWKGEAVFVATDPYGAASEIHIPLSVNAAKAGRTEEAGQQVRGVDSRQLTEAELIKKAEEDAARFETMTREEVDAELRRRDALERK